MYNNSYIILIKGFIYMLIFDKKFFFVFCFSVFSLQNVHGITSPNSNKQEKECNQAEYYTIVDLYQAITNYNLPLIKKILGMYPAYINRVTHWQDPKAFFENNTKRNVTIFNEQLYTPLQIAILTKAPDNIIECLLENGADPYVKNRNNENAIDIAFRDDKTTLDILFPYSDPNIAIKTSYTKQFTWLHYVLGQNISVEEKLKKLNQMTNNTKNTSEEKKSFNNLTKDFYNKTFFDYIKQTTFSTNDQLKICVTLFNRNLIDSFCPIHKGWWWNETTWLHLVLRDLVLNPDKQGNFDNLIEKSHHWQENNGGKIPFSNTQDENKKNIFDYIRGIPTEKQKSVCEKIFNNHLVKLPFFNPSGSTPEIKDALKELRKNEFGGFKFQSSRLLNWSKDHPYKTALIAGAVLGFVLYKRKFSQHKA